MGYAGARAGSSEPYLLQEGKGVVLGKLFERSSGPSTPAPLIFDEARARLIIASRGRRLIDRYWGRYVAFLHDDSSGTSWVLRDPSAGLPCLTVRFGGVHIYFSLIEDVLALGLGPFDVNWSFLAAGVCQMREHTQGTALCDVSQVVGGECLELHGEKYSSTFYWDALQIANANIIEDPAQATKALRSCVRDAVHAWASAYGSILLSVSGGLDSSIVFSCLRDAPAKPDLTCFHYYPTGSDMDERGYARLVAKSGHRELIERARDSRLSLEPLLNVKAFQEPGNYLYHLEHSRLDARLAAEHGATASFVGWGGDQLFFQERAIWAAGDYLHYHGLSPAVLRIALESAQMDRVSIWQVLREAAGQYAMRRRWSVAEDVGRFRSLVRADVVEEVRSSGAYLHPLLRDSRGTPSGKLWHAHQLSGPWEFYDPLGEPGDPETVAPLYSQPVIELCLRLPLHVLTLGGWDRAIARRAFYSDLPLEIVNRRNKGGIEAHLRAILEHNLAFVRELLIDGALVRQGLVDRNKLTTILSGKASRIQASSGELFDFIAAEVWLRRLKNQAGRAAA
ncbi:MAG: putative asparagine synthase [Gammaproteobacteria bacterium]|nr:putative asparagine synthase [Gammaproteobacteria bacterium]